MLIVKIDRKLQTAEFSGNTFESKETIKSFGAAKWDGARKVWKVSPFTLGREAIESALPGAQIEEFGEHDDAATQVALITSNTLLEQPLGQSEDTRVGEVKAGRSNSGQRVLLRSSTDAAGTGGSAELTDAGVSAAGIPASISVVELVARAEQAILSSFPERLFVRGVISSVKARADSTVYLHLSSEEDSDQLINCVIWGRDARRILSPLTEKGFQLEADLSVMFGVQVRMNKRRAEISLTIVSVVAEYTLAKLLAQREKTNERLRAEGIFDRNRQCVLTALPKRLGLITSSTGTVIHDFRTALDTSRFGFELFWCHASVQGESAARELIAALQTLDRQGVDAILVFRGGGSAGDLAVFNDYSVARAVCFCGVPVFSAIGHQEDQSSVQDVSFHTEGVPQGLGRYFAERVVRYRREVEQSARRIEQRVVALSDFWMEKLTTIAVSSVRTARQVVQTQQIDAAAVISSVKREAHRVQSIHLQRTEQLARLFSAYALGITRSFQKKTTEFPRQIASLIHSSLRYRIDRLENLQVLVASSSPDVQLKRGFALVRKLHTEEYVIRSQLLSKTEELELIFHDASVTVRVE